MATTTAVTFLFVYMETTFSVPKNCTFMKTGSTVFRNCQEIPLFPCECELVDNRNEEREKKYKRLCAYCQLVVWPENYSGSMFLSVFQNVSSWSCDFSRHRITFAGSCSRANGQILCCLISHISKNRGWNCNRWYVNQSRGHMFLWKWADTSPARLPWKFSGMCCAWCCRLTYR